MSDERTGDRPLTAKSSSLGDHRATVYKNAVVVSADSKFSLHDALLVEDGVIQHVGTNDEVCNCVSGWVDIVDLQGRMVLPGLIDAHAHIGLQAHSRLYEPSLVGLSSVGEILDVIEEAAKKVSQQAWIVTSPIGEPPDHFNLPQSLKERRWPSLEELDRVAPANPVYIPTPVAWPYPAFLNSHALCNLELPKNSGEGVWREVDSETGNPTGAVHGLNIYNTKSDVTRKALMIEQRATGAGFVDADASKPGFAGALRDVLKQNLRAGVTAVYEGHMNTYVDVLRTLRAEGVLPSHVACAYEIPANCSLEYIEKWFEQLKDSTGDEQLDVCGATISLDGAIQFGKAHMNEPYLNPYGEVSNGNSKVSIDALIAIASLAVKYKVRLNILAAGDAAIDNAMASLRAVNAKTPLRGRGWVVQHFQHPSKQDIAELAEMGMVAQSYAHAEYSKGAEVYCERLQGDHWQRVIPLRWWFDAGVPVALGSDGAHANPFFEIWQALSRTDGRTGRSLMTDPKRISRKEAIMSMTINGAIVMGMENKIGSIEPGKAADFLVIDRNILQCDIDDIRETRVLATVFGGQVAANNTGQVLQ